MLNSFKLVLLAAMGYHTEFVNCVSYLTGIGAAMGYHTLIRQSYILLSCFRQYRVFVDRTGVLVTGAGGRNTHVRLDQVWRGLENLWCLIGCEVLDSLGNCDCHTLLSACSLNTSLLSLAAGVCVVLCCVVLG